MVHGPLSISVRRKVLRCRNPTVTKVAEVADGTAVSHLPPFLRN